MAEIETGVAADSTTASMIGACNRLISSGKLNRHDLAVAYYNRGLARKAWAVSMMALSSALATKAATTGNAPLTKTPKNPDDLDGAIADFDEVIRLDPKDTRAYTNRGRVRQLKGDLTGAISDWDQAIRLDSENVEAYVLRGIALQTKGYIGAAVRDYDWAISLDPKNAVAYYNRGLAWESKRRYQSRASRLQCGAHDDAKKSRRI
ncbi:MAG: tetratricopeptide repeat protein [Xanthobacteraceae bacterium]